MNWFLATALVVVAAVIVEIWLPGRPAYHAGWYNVALTALAIVVVVTGRKQWKAVRSSRSRLAIVAVALGAVAMGLAGVATGLFAPDDRDVVGAPGERVRVEDVGTLSFPLAGEDRAGPIVVRLDRPLHAPLEVGAPARNAGNFILRAVPRDVVDVEVRDLLGSRLTVTQPNGRAFLSPVLLMQARQTIAGMDVPFDSFNVPAARRVVKAILFTPAQAAVVLHDPAAPGQSAVLFAVDDENDRPLPHGIVLSARGEAVRAGGLWLRADVTSYPSIEVIWTPNIAVVAAGSLLVLGGLVGLGLLMPRHNRANVA
ncbi:MAG TPA: hypothetical protein VKR56_01695 [Candidatus Cybelea sp.]|nr:hypothetical protein [Candidatus Cybelea sp.]